MIIEKLTKLANMFLIFYLKQENNKIRIMESCLIFIKIKNLFRFSTFKIVKPKVHQNENFENLIKHNY